MHEPPSQHPSSPPARRETNPLAHTGEAVDPYRVPQDPGPRHLAMGSPVPDREQPIWTGGPSVLAVVPPLVKSLFWLVVWLALFQTRPRFLGAAPVAEFVGQMPPELREHWATVVMGLGLVLLFFAFLNVLAIGRSFLRLFNTHYQFTTQRVRYRTGILNLSTVQVELFRLKDIHVTQSLWARMCGYVNVEIVSSERVAPRLHIWGLPGGDRIIENVRVAAQYNRAQSGTMQLRE